MKGLKEEQTGGLRGEPALASEGRVTSAPPASTASTASDVSAPAASGSTPRESWKLSTSAFLLREERFSDSATIRRASASEAALAFATATRFEA